MRNIVITAESGADLPVHLEEKYQVRVVPMHIVMENVDYPDGSIPVEQIYDYHSRTKKIPTTSAVNVAEYVEMFEKIRAEDPDCVIFNLAYSGGASCTCQNCRLAMQDFEDIYLVDTQNVSGGQTAFIAKAFEIIEKNRDTKDFQKLADELQSWSARTYCSFIPGNLDFLKAGGRVSNAQYLGATLLHLKPLIEMTDGKLVAGRKYRGTMERIVDKYMEEFVEGHELSKECLYLLYSKGVSQEIYERMKENALRLGFRTCEYIQTGCVVSTHSGPGAIGLAGYAAS